MDRYTLKLNSPSPVIFNITPPPFPKPNLIKIRSAGSDGLSLILQDKQSSWLTVAYVISDNNRVRKAMT